MALATVGDLVSEVRRMVQDQDTTAPRWAEINYYQALNVAMMEAYRLRADLFRNSPDVVPQFEITDGAAITPINFQYVPATLMFMSGWVQLADDEGTEDQRASALMQMFTAKLINHAS